ncbi:PP2C family serine/threonine-protein phosphatase [Stakelama tenebrarum]|uniref:Protein phosphatase 2C domain-containing protein n=1 Tax=Stakelama tenebrarum TaxID=2711215 RepID=A0A6G6Y4D5_9SPHN|nr:PP2C family serine/threonine-protein phosphatase [Sphingosinithalassobacter tenebrarum]QIG79759.1 protein phosphatase 2C domain-containing protein [Sphingosinithalassobacter tenebrarum]
MLATPAWRVAGSSITGPSHVQTGTPCQDRHRLHVAQSGALIAIVSDGAGSAEYGGEGAALLCDRLVARLDRHLSAGVRKTGTRAGLLGLCRAVREGVHDAREAARAQGAEAGVGLESFHATLVGAVMLPRQGGLFFHIGDGAALAIGGDGERWQLSAPSNGEYADTTYFYTEPDWRTNLRFSLIDGGYDTIFVMTDGVTDLALSARPGGHEPFMPFFRPIGRYLAGATREEGEEALSATLDSGAVRERTSDDKTLVWAQVAGP